MEPQLAELISSGKVSFEYRHYVTLGTHSQWAAEASECAADQDKFWAYHDVLLKNQGRPTTPEQLKTWAKDLGLEPSVFNECLDKHKNQYRVQTQSNEARMLGVNGAPTFFLNNKLLRPTSDPGHKTDPYVLIVEAVKAAVGENGLR